MAKNHVRRVNDVPGFRKELRERDPGNMVLRQEDGLTPQDVAGRGDAGDAAPEPARLAAPAARADDRG